MSVERATCDGGAAGIETTGASLTFRADGTIAARQRIPAARDVALFTLGGVAAGPWRIERQDTATVVLRAGAATATVRGDSVVILDAPRGTTLSARAAFAAAYHETERGRSILLDEVGGFGVYPVAPVADRGADATRSPLPVTGATWLAIFPPRAADPAIETSPLAHEGRPQRLGRGLDDAYPSRGVLEDAARTCRILAVHAYVWRAAPLAVRLRPGRHFLRRCEWRTPRHEPADPARFRRLLDDARALGLRVLLYVSPRHSTAPDIFGEMERILAEHAPDGFYLDEIADDLPTLDATVRRARAIVGPDRLLYLNAVAEPFGTPRVWAPFVDAHCDLVLRGSEGRAGLPLATFLRYAVSGRNTSGAAGHWCHYGGGVVERPPTDEELAAARAAGAHLWRRSRWGAAALARFDACDSGSR